MDYADFFNKAASSWFFAEPALYRTFCLHKVCENTQIDVAFRSGQKRIEYNPNLFGKMSAAAIKKLFKREVIRCTLGHPYQRRPNPFDAGIAYQASNLVIDQQKDFLKNHELLPNQCFEYYYYNLYFEEYGKFENDKDDSNEAKSFESKNDKAPGGFGGDVGDSESFGDSGTDSKGSGDESSDRDDGDSDNKRKSEVNGDNTEDNNELDDGAGESATELWDFNADAIEQARESIEEFGKILENSKNRSTLPYNISELIEKKKERLPKHVNIMHLFKGSVTSSLVHLTRMRPSRRSGFLQPGKKHERLPNILCAIDTSGSVSSDTVEKMISVAWGIFKTGIEKLDLITFDIKVNTKRPIPYKARGSLKIMGRGGTDFQPPVDFFEKTRNYDGLIIITDGYAPVPKLKFKGSRKKILCFIYGREILPQSYFYKIFSKTGFVTSFEKNNFGNNVS